MRENTVRRNWELGKPVLNGWLSLANTFSAELMANAGWHSVCIDLQHGLVGYSDAVLMMQAMSSTPVAPLIRVPWNDPAICMKMLDAGAAGIICPMINTAEEARSFVSACRYPPRGSRSFGPTRANLYAGSDYADHADDWVVLLAMIETRDGVRNLREILATPGLDGVYIGPADLSRSLQQDLMALEAEQLPAMVEEIIGSAKEAGRHAGIHLGSVAQADRMIRAGCDFVTVLSDVRLLAAAASALVTDLSALTSKLEM